MAVISHICILQLHQRGREGSLGRRQGERRDTLLDDRRDRLQLGEALHARLGLRRLAGLRAEPVDETLQMGPLGLLLVARGGLQPQLFAPAPFEIVVPARVEIELALAHMEDGVDRIVQQLAVVADDQSGVRVLLEPGFEPKSALEIEIIGRFVEEEQIRLGKERSRQRDPHPPATGKFRHGTGQVRGREPEAAQNLTGAGRGPISVDFDQAPINVAHAFGFGAFQLEIQGIALDIGRQDGVEERNRRRRVLLIHRGDAGRFRERNFATVWLQFSQNQLEQGGFSHTVPADQPDFRAGGKGDGRFVKKAPAPSVEDEVLDLKHENWAER